jgi:hypothetical protein
LKERSNSAAVVISVNGKQIESPMLIVDISNANVECGVIGTFNSNSVKRLVGLYCECIEDRGALAVLPFSAELSCELQIPREDIDGGR